MEARRSPSAAAAKMRSASRPRSRIGDPAQEERDPGVDGEHERPDHGEQREPGEVLQRDRAASASVPRFGRPERIHSMPARPRGIHATTATSGVLCRWAAVQPESAKPRAPNAAARGLTPAARRNTWKRIPARNDVERGREEEEVERLEERREKVRRIEGRRERVGRVRHAAQDRVVPERDLARRGARSVAKTRSG